VADISEDAWDQVLDVNLKGVFLTSKYVIPEMIRGDGGSIINTSSMLSLISRLHRAAYVASKGGVNALTRAMAIDLAPAHIRVNCICPGLIETEMVRGQLQKVREDLMEWNRLMAEIPLGRIGKPEDVAHTALFLASDESAWITGTSISVDGGYTAR
jgi:NAD(P)-dependent dehydrogenase (short-subunit alcohol dehydrogenase family)